MRLLGFHALRASLLLAALAIGGLSAGRAESPTTPTSSSTTPPAVAETTTGGDADSALTRAMDFERRRNWSGAIEVYHDALDRWPSRTDLKHRLRLCEIHYRLGRRYQDRSFRDVLLRLTRERALDLYDELLERIATHYVEPVAMEPMLRRGLDNLEVGLRDPAFLRNNAANADPERVKALRDGFRKQRDTLTAHDRGQAIAQVVSACDLGRELLGLNATAVVLEFVYGACDALDDYSCYLSPDKLDDLYSMIDGNFVGLGIELKVDDRGLRLVGVIPGGPADEAGFRVGDHITHVGGRSVVGQGLDEAAGKLQGVEGSVVEIGLLRADGTGRRLKLVRREVEVKSVAQAKIIDSQRGVGYVQLTGFQKTSTDELDRAILELRKQGLRYLVLDLRGNPGGLLNVAVEIADGFLDGGVIVSTRGRGTGQTSVYHASQGAAWRMPMSVLIDHDSASASEILAGALKDLHRAVVIGQRSYGKGSVQSIYTLRSAPTGLKLTTAKFYSPTNRPYSEQGVEPDLAIRVAAKPTGDDSAIPDPSFGDLAKDVVLDRALEQAKRQLTPTN